MFKRIKDFFAKRVEIKKQMEQNKKVKEYYKLLQGGASLFQYIENDMVKVKKTMNRSQRRRFDVDMHKKGKFSKETVYRYLDQINDILMSVEENEAKMHKTMVSKIVAKEVKKALFMESLKK